MTEQQFYVMWYNSEYGMECRDRAHANRVKKLLSSLPVDVMVHIAEWLVEFCVIYNETDVIDQVKKGNRHGVDYFLKRGLVSLKQVYNSLCMGPLPLVTSVCDEWPMVKQHDFEHYSHHFSSFPGVSALMHHGSFEVVRYLYDQFDEQMPLELMFKYAIKHSRVDVLTFLHSECNDWWFVDGVITAMEYMDTSFKSLDVLACLVRLLHLPTRDLNIMALSNIRNSLLVESTVTFKSLVMWWLTKFTSDSTTRAVERRCFLDMINNGCGVSIAHHLHANFNGITNSFLKEVYRSGWFDHELEPFFRTLLCYSFECRDCGDTIEFGEGMCGSCEKDLVQSYDDY